MRQRYGFVKTKISKIQLTLFNHNFKFKKLVIYQTKVQLTYFFFNTRI